MESSLAALIIFTVALFSANLMAHSYLTTQELIQHGWQVMEARNLEQLHTDLAPIQAVSKSAGVNVELTLGNSGDVRLADFDQWDVIVEYYTASNNYRIAWLNYTSATSPGAGEWTVLGIYVDAATAQAEVFEPGIFNPGEEIVVQMRLSNPVGVGTTNLAVLGVSNGTSTSMSFTR